MNTYCVRTFGCQMNKHDSERIAGLLASQGLTPVPEPEVADVVVFNTCCVRERAEERLRGQVASLKSSKDRRPGMLIAVGGCIAQRDGEGLTEDLPHVDVVFGTHDIAALPDLLEQARLSGATATRVGDESDAFASDLPSVRETLWRAWLPIIVGCDNHCAYCIVPRVRGGERSRPFESVVQEATRLVEDGVVEITLLGQNVNSYGRDVYGDSRFPELLTAVAQTGVRRIRFVTSHPKDLSKDTIAVMAGTESVCPALHLPVQSGSSRVLALMNRGYSRDEYLSVVDRLYDSIPHLALSTDLMVGFPGETEEDFSQTLDLVERARFAQAFTFIFSPREGTAGASLPDRVSGEVAQERFDRLVTSVSASARTGNEKVVGTVAEVLVEGPSKRDPDLLHGRTPTNKVVHAPWPTGSGPATLEGRFADVAIEAAKTWYLEGRVVSAP